MKLFLEKRNWWGYLEEDLQELLSAALLLADKTEGWEEKFHDYSFVVFPAAKAYEGFLKKLFLDYGFISQKDYYGKHFRIGKALNPALEENIRDKEGVYDKIVNFCGGRELADRLWETWKTSRNLLFHWFPDEKNAITLGEAKTKVEGIISTIDQAFNECRTKKELIKAT